MRYYVVANRTPVTEWESQARVVTSDDDAGWLDTLDDIRLAGPYASQAEADKEATRASEERGDKLPKEFRQ